MTGSHFGVVEYHDGTYRATAGSGNWSVQPILGFNPPIRAPLGQVEICFASPLDEPYAVLVTALRDPCLPLLGANYGNVSATGFVVHLWEIAADRTLVNGSFSFLVIPAGSGDA